ncbi:MAG: autotransporter outer membrane beta-barrel domain-containing protein [Hyphomicrobiaceae bacterium]
MDVLLKKTLNTTLAVSVLVAFMPQEAKAACGSVASAGSGPPSISATEVSTAQALQLIRKRRDEAVAGGGGNVPIQVAQNLPQPAPVQAAPKPAPAPVVQAPKPAPVAQAPKPVQAPAATPVTPPPAVAQAAKPAPAPAPAAVAKVKKPDTIVAIKKPAQKKVVLAEKPAAPRSYPVQSYQSSLKDDVIELAPEPTRGAWAQVYGDYEYHSGWTLDGGTRGALSSQQYTGGVVTGLDWLVRGTAGGTSKLLVGVLGGFSATKTNFGDVQYTEDDQNNNPATFNRTNATETIEGGGGGVYAVLTSNRFSADAMVKVDGYDLQMKDTVSPIECFQPDNRQGSTDFATFTLTSNVAYRYDMGSQTFFEPTAGIRYTHASYGNQSGALPLGLVDGDALRLQAGGRIGRVQELPNGHVVVSTLGAMLYSDVVVEGFSRVNSLGFNTAEIDEGKLRVMGQFSTHLIAGNGFTYSLQADVRGGEDVFGVGGKLGVRYEW